MEAAIFIRNEAVRLGFDFCGIARAVKLDADARRLELWLHKGYQGQMSYLERHFEERVDPRRLVPGARSVITLLKNYYPTQEQDTAVPRVARYAYGEDYHLVIRQRLQEFLFELRSHFGDIQGRGFVDSAPVLEKSWAVQSGAGWIGKNGNLISFRRGSYFFIATLIVDLELPYDEPYTNDYCGSCTRCIEACPTEAILPDRILKADQCISYFTIELKEALIPGKPWNDWVFGCDICQEVCPWNRFATPHQELAFAPYEEILHFDLSNWRTLTEDVFKKRFKNSPLIRTRYQGMQRNLSFVLPGTKSADQP